MTINLNGVLINGETNGVLWNGGNRMGNVQVSASAALAGTLNICGAGGASFTTTPGLVGTLDIGPTGSVPFDTPEGLDGAQSLVDLHGPAYFKLSDPADVGKVRVTWSMG